MYVKVIIDNPTSNVDFEYTYKVPDEYQEIIKKGARVKIPFGVANRLIMGYVSATDVNPSDISDIKTINELLDIEPLISEIQWQLVEYIKNDTMSQTSRILNLMIPRLLRLKTDKYLVVTNLFELDANLVALFKGKTKIKYSNELMPFHQQINKALKERLLKVSYDAKSYGGKTTVNKYRVNQQFFLDNQFAIKSLKQRLFLEYYFHQQDYLTKDELFSDFEITENIFKTLVKNGYLEVIKQTVLKKTLTDELSFEIEHPPHVLSQAFTLNDKPYLFVPRSKKEEQDVVISLISETLKSKKRCLVICPDILSSYKYASWLRQTVKTKVACFNSDLTDVEIFNQYLAIDEYLVYVSTCAHALYPFVDLGLVIMIDSDSKYYQNSQSPYYDFREVWRYFQKIVEDVKLVFHSYVPCLADYKKALASEYVLVENHKQGKRQIIHEVIDLKKQLLLGNTAVLAPSLITAIKQQMVMKKISLLIINNKNYSKYVTCRKCNETLKCEKCQIPFQYQKTKNQLICPVCYNKKIFENNCIQCGSDKLLYGGFGMESVVEQLRKEIDNIKITIIDSSQFNEVSQKIELINNHEVDVVISSDTFSRGFEDDNIGLVSIIDLDMMENAPYFNAKHLAYSALVHAENQLCENGKMIIQTSNPSSHYLKAFLLNDYDLYFSGELDERALLKLEPLYYVNRLLIKAPYGEGFKIASKIKRMLNDLSSVPLIMLGPSFNYYHMAIQLVVKHQYEDISKIYQIIYQMYQQSQVIIIFDKYSQSLC